MTKSNKVLVVEDDDTLRAIIVTQLKRLGVAASAATNGENAIQLYALGQYELVLMDVQMPVMDGLEATRAIRKMERLEDRQRVPIIAVTANPIVDSCFQAGMDDFLFKPIMISHIKMLLERWLAA